MSSLRRVGFLIAVAALTPFAARADDAFDRAVQRAAAAVEQRVVQLQAIGGATGLGGAAASRPTSGLLLEVPGLIATSAYAFDPRPESILVTTADGKRLAGRLLGVDHNRGVAIIQADDLAEPPGELLTSPGPRVGETVIAIGRTFRADAVNVAVGIVSATDRLHGRAVQTDAAASPANYGGPLVDLRGRVVGLLTPLAPRELGDQGGVGWYDSGIAFTTPLPTIRQRLPRLRQGEDIRRGLVGWKFAEGSPYTTPPRIGVVHPDGPADKAGLKKGDFVRQVSGVAIKTIRDWRAAADAADDGDRLAVTVEREKLSIEVTLELVAELPKYRHSALGVVLGRAAPDGEQDDPGVVVEQVLADGPAARAGVLPADRIVSIAGDEASSRQALLSRLAEAPPGRPVELSIVRSEQPVKLSIELASLAFTLVGEPPAPCEVEREEFPAPGTERLCKLHKPKRPGPAPTLIWLGGGLAGDDISVLAARGVLVVEIEPAKQTTAAGERACVAALLPQLLVREEVESTRLAIGGGGVTGGFALLIASADDMPFGGVVLGRRTQLGRRLPQASVKNRTGVLLAPGSGLLEKRLAETGLPTLRQDSPSAASVAHWLSGLDQL
ncbi:MAG: PDZ domain-containing protein [Planctomycetota bacterium]